MCPWLSGKKCLSCSTARVKALLLFLLTVLSGKGSSGTKVCQDSPPEWAAGEKGFRANEKSHQAQNVSFLFWALVTKAKEVPRLGEKERGFCLPSAQEPQEPHRWTFGQSEGDLLSQTHWKQGFSTSSLFYSRLCPQLWGSVFSDLSFLFSPDEALLLAKTN